MRYILYINTCSFIISYEFNGDSAFVHIEKQCSFGPRYPGSEGHKNLSEYLYTFFNQYSDYIQEYNDTIIHPVSNQKIESLGWIPRYTLDDGITELIKGYKLVKPNSYANA